MYTGITQGLFVITDVSENKGIVTYKIKLDDQLLKGLEIGASISVDGVCQTVVKKEEKEITLNAIEETCQKTTLRNLKIGQLVSIERSAVYGTEIGGHAMFGHIYGIAVLIEKIKTQDNLCLTFRCDHEMMEYIFKKGFIGIDGSSLTVNKVDLLNNTFTVNLIPHTLQLTNFLNKNIGDEFNIELDASTMTIVEVTKRQLSHFVKS